MFLTLSQFLDHFPSIQISKEDFLRQFVITYKGQPTLENLFGLQSVIKTMDDPRYIHRQEILDYFYDVIVINRHHYLTEFYKSYFELPDPYSLKWDGVPIETRTVEIDLQSLNERWRQHPDDTNLFDQLLTQPLPCLSLQKNDLSRKIIRNLNYLEILHTTTITNTVKSKVSFWQSLVNVYNHLRLEDRFFAPSSIGLFLREKPTGGTNFNNFFYLFQQYQPKASILNPYTINYILKHHLTGTKLFTPVLSWTSYLLAFFHTDYQHYVGCDVIPNVCQRCQFLFDYYQTQLKPKLKSPKETARLDQKTLDLYCQPSETLLHNPQFMERYMGYFDSVILSPPYFDMEIYQEGQQSIQSYPRYEDWLQGYWTPTVELCQRVLSTGGRFGFIINDYISLKKTEYHLIHDLNMIALKHFRLINVYRLANRVSPLRSNAKERTEMLFIYVKEDLTTVPRPIPAKIRYAIKLKKLS